MLSDEEVRLAAGSHLTDAEVRMLVNAELGGFEPDLPDIRLKLAADLLCDAAMEVAADRFDAQKIKKLFVQDDLQIPFSELAIVSDVDRNVKSGSISKEELYTLLLRGSVAHVVSQAVANGVSEEDIAGGEITVTALRIAAMRVPKKKGFLSKLFSRE